ncbi:propionyl-CoA carboxylase subunit beta [Algimonas ampicilliniresistens]|uniref:Propionyl-CoA carboxylase subunit beta n=1 Tax=Algimonas ampicilliniresistens TaxID=1298735 RepID=A0ABQ5V6M8_9PROT|nr:carboxyl transferase domain-containing protein [Algimonas ampicilliniresistens]GLQ23206.1 propionyl-CoA carboxylase subunit beta [Algimonas ampicilliniresistens]
MPDQPTDWSAELEQKALREGFAEDMGGADKVARQKGRGKLTARERIDGLLDDGSFREIGKLAGAGQYDADGKLIRSAASNFIYGQGAIAGRPVVASADDFTVRGGASDAAIYRKFIHAEKMASEFGIPLVRMIDGTGGGGSVKSLETMGYTYVPEVPGFETITKNLRTVPVVALALGPCAGLGAARVVASHYSVMVKGLSQVFTAGPAIVAPLGESLDKEGLGGSDIHTRNGVVDDEAESEADAFVRARAFLSFLPDRAGDPIHRHVTSDDPNRIDEQLLSIIPRDRNKAYSMRAIVRSVMDEGSVFEIGRKWGRASITALARLDGWPVAVIASDPSFLGGSWTADTADKVKRHVELAELFELPIVHLVDNPGFMIGLEAEKAATIRRGVETMSAIYSATVPWASVIIRKAYGVAGAAMSDHTRFQYRAAWPSGDWGSLPIDGGVEVAYQSELAASDDPAAELASIKARLAEVSSPFRTAERYGVEDIIDPRETRPFLTNFIQLAMRRA